MEGLTQALGEAASWRQLSIMAASAVGFYFVAAAFRIVLVSRKSVHLVGGMRPRKVSCYFAAFLHATIASSLASYVLLFDEVVAKFD